MIASEYDDYGLLPSQFFDNEMVLWVFGVDSGTRNRYFVDRLTVDNFFFVTPTFVFNLWQGSMA